MPIALLASSTMTSRPARARARATARPITPAPMTTVSILYLDMGLFYGKNRVPVHTCHG